MHIPAACASLEASEFSIDAFSVVRRRVPNPGQNEILIRVRAVSLNYRDLAVLSGAYIPDLQLPLVLASDAFRRMEAGAHFGKIVVKL